MIPDDVEYGEVIYDDPRDEVYWQNELDMRRELVQRQANKPVGKWAPADFEYDPLKGDHA